MMGVMLVMQIAGSWMSEFTDERLAFESVGGGGGFNI